MKDALTPNTFGVWVGLKTRKSAFDGRKNRPGLKQEHEEALLDDQARQDYLDQKAKDDAKAAAVTEVTEPAKKIILTDGD
jgi:hypothetical protein